MKVLFAGLVLSAFALPAAAAQLSIEERGGIYIVDYRGDAPEKSAQATEEPGSSTPPEEPAPDSAAIEPPSPQPVPQPEAQAEPQPEPQPEAQAEPVAETTDNPEPNPQ